MPNTRDGQVLSQSHDGMKLTETKKSKRGTPVALKVVSPLKFLAEGGDDHVPCMICEKEADGKQIQCDRCLQWLHINCAGLKVSQYRFIADQNIPGLKWFCNACQESESNPSEPDVHIAQQGAKIDNLGILIASMQQQQTAMQQQNLLILQMIKDRNAETAFQDKIRVHVSEELDERNEKELVKNNIIIRGVPEDDSDDVDVNKREDIQKVSSILTHVHPHTNVAALDKQTVIRCGKAKRPPGAAPRPIKVILSENDRACILKNEKKMTEYVPIKRVRITRDKTRKEQEDDKKRYLECEQKRKETNQDYIIFRNMIVLREDIPGIIEDQKSASRDPKVNADRPQEEGD